MSSYFFLQANKNARNGDFLSKLEEYSVQNKKLIYILDSPLTDQKYSYKYSQALIILSPNNKITIIDFGNGKAEFDDYIEDVIEDIGSISDKYLYKEVIGRTRVWRDSLIESEINYASISNIDIFFFVYRFIYHKLSKPMLLCRKVCY